MSMTKAVLKAKLPKLNEQLFSHGYIVDDEGKEVRITSKMVKMACHQLLKQCRSIKST
jgi:hypothetical protein